MKKTNFLRQSMCPLVGLLAGVVFLSVPPSANANLISPETGKPISIIISDIPDGATDIHFSFFLNTGFILDLRLINPQGVIHVLGGISVNADFFSPTVGGESFVATGHCFGHPIFVGGNWTFPDGSFSAINNANVRIFVPDRGSTLGLLAMAVLAICLIHRRCERRQVCSGRAG